MRSKLRIVAVLCALVLALAWSIPSVGQVLKGSISGTVVDPQGAVVSGADVQAKSVETGAVFKTTSDSSGLYRLNLLPAGTYNVSISAKGFKTTETRNLIVAAGQDQGMGSTKLNVGGTSETVEVTAAAPLIETTQAQITNTFTGETLTRFAGVQENEGLDRLALFVPGVVATRSDNFSNTNGVGFSSNGLRGRNNDQEVDGQNNNDNSVAGPGLFLTDTEFVGQYVIVTNNFGPEYGRNSGSVVNIITKSGTNGWHGSVFGQDRSSYLDALTNTQHNSFQPGTIPPKPFTGPPRFNEEFSGGTLGGPIVKNKAFLFGGFDSDLFSGTSVFTTTSSFPTPLGLAQLAGCGANATALGVLQKFGPYAFGFGNPSPRPLGAGGAFTTQTVGSCLGVQVAGVTRVVASPDHIYDFVLRHDLQLAGDSITGRYLYNRNNTFGTNSSGTTNAAGGWVNNVPALSQDALISWTHNFTTRMVNEARVSFGRLNVVFGGGPNPFLPSAGGLLNTFTNITFQAGGTMAVGPATNIPQSRLVNTWQAQDNWNYVLGKHSFKAGVNWTYQRSPNTFLPLVNGGYRFANLGQFLFGCLSCGPGGAALGPDVPNRIQVAQGTPTLDFREYDTFLFAGDDWKIGKNLTLNLGVTWTYYGQPDNLFNQITAPRESNPATAFWLQSLPASITTDPTIPAVLNSFGPSVGFAYSPQWGGFLGHLIGHNQTTIRGGYRMSYDPPYYNIFLNQSTSAPMTFLQTITDAPSLNGSPMPGNPIGPNVRTALAPTIKPNFFDPRTQNETNITPNFGPDKVQSWSLGFEREVTKNGALEVRYVGNHGYNLFQTIDGNPYVGTAAAPGQLQAGLLPSGTTSCAATTQVGPGAGTDVGRLNCGLGVVRTRTNTGFSDYHAVQTEFRANNMFKQLTLRAGYTFSKTLDNVSEIFATGTAGNTLFAAQNPFQNGGAERSTSGLSIPNVFTLIAVEQIPFFKEQHGLVGHILGGWTLSADYVLASGQPYTPQQAFEEALVQSPFHNVYDSAWVNAFVGTDTARPFVGSVSAPVNAVGVFAGNACSATNAACTPAQTAALALLAGTQLVSLNALNSGTTAASVVPITNNQARFIMNTGIAQTVFGTPFGNMPRNPVRDARANVLNGTIYKNIKLGERANFEMHLTMNNALNHFNFSTVDPSLEHAGVGLFGTDFANPSVTSTLLSQFGYRTVWVGGKISF